MNTRSGTADTRHGRGIEAEASPTRHRFSVQDYYAMARAGILTEDDRVELLDGEVVVMTPIGSRHAVCVDRVTRLFFLRFDGRAAVRVQNPVRLSGNSEPQPDVALLELPLERYAAAHPSPPDVLLVVEVADTSLERDRALKLPLYARAGISDIWIVNLEEGEIEIYRTPSSAGYAEVQRLREGTVTPLAFPGEAIGVEEILGPPRRES
jgi:Uma2 family endonuclease